jgi:hypothetical protein
VVHERGVQVQVYRQKTRKHDDPVVMYRADPELCPVRAVLAWIATLEKLGRVPGPLLIRIDRRGRIVPPLTRGGVPVGDPEGRMSGQAVGNVITRCAAAAGLTGAGPGTACAAAWPLPSTRPRR